MRTSHIVNMDLVSGLNSDKDEISSENLARFVSKYLNAARVGKGAIEKWSAVNDFNEKPFSKCDSCQFKEKCHGTFGEVEGLGLYPLTEKAIWNLTQRVEEHFPRIFNPRIIQSELLYKTLNVYVNEIQRVKFPSEEFLNDFGGPTTIPTVKRSALRTQDEQKASRWVPFLEIYDGQELNKFAKELMSTLDIDLILTLTTLKSLNLLM